MGAAYFYHLTQRPMEDTLAMLLGKARQAGWRVAVRATSEARVVWLDQQLWQVPGFLAHGCARGTQDADQPILLGLADVPTGDRTCIMSVDGAAVAAEEVAAMDRVCVLFDGNDAEGLAQARLQWKTLKDAGAAAQYWSEASGRWERMAQTGGEAPR